MPLFWFHDSKGLPLVISSGKRAGMQGSMGTLSPEISYLHASCTIRGGDFSTPLRYGRNDEDGRQRFCHLGREISPLCSAAVEMTRGALANIVISSGAAWRYGADRKRSHDTLSREISHRNATRIIRGGDFSTPLRFGRNDEDEVRPLLK